MMNSRKDPMLTFSAPWRFSVKILLVASPKALFSTLTSSLFGVCVASACRVTAALLLKTLLNSGWLLWEGTRPALVFMIRSAYVWNTTMCGSVLVGQLDKSFPGCTDITWLTSGPNSPQATGFANSSITITDSSFHCQPSFTPVTTTKMGILCSTLFPFWQVQIHTHIMECDPEKACMNDRIHLMIMPAETLGGVLRQNGHTVAWPLKCLFIQHGRKKRQRQQSWTS